MIDDWLRKAPDLNSRVKELPLFTTRHAAFCALVARLAWSSTCTIDVFIHNQFTTIFLIEDYELLLFVCSSSSGMIMKASRQAGLKLQ